MPIKLRNEIAIEFEKHMESAKFGKIVRNGVNKKE
jgi:hypothetical protein